MATQRLGLGVSVSVGVDRRSGALLGVDQGKGKGAPPKESPILAFTCSRLLLLPFSSGFHEDESKR